MNLIKLKTAFTGKVNNTYTGIFSMFLLLFVFVINGCSDKINEPMTNNTGIKNNNSATTNTKYNYAEINESMEKMAVSIAKSLKSQDMRVIIKNEITTNSNGHGEILYKNIKNKTLATGEVFSKKISSGYAEFKKTQGENISTSYSASEVESLSNKIPNFHIAMHKNLAEWDANSYTPLVTFRPVGIKLKDLQEIKAFDSDGNVHIIKKGDKIENPIIVLGVNKRIHNNNSIITPVIGPEAVSDTMGWDPGTGGDQYIQVTLTTGNFANLATTQWHDVWGGILDGDPEFYVDVYGQTEYQRTYLTGITYNPFDLGILSTNYYNTHTFNLSLLTVVYNTQYLHIHFAEEDGGLLGGDDVNHDFWNVPVGHNNNDTYQCASQDGIILNLQYNIVY